MTYLEKARTETLARRQRLGLATTSPRVSIPTPVPPAAPTEPPPIETDELCVARIDAEIATARELLNNCAMPRRYRLVILPVLQEHGMSWTALLIGREQPKAEIRFEIFELLRQAGASMSDTARWFGLDRTAIRHGLLKRGVRL
jgi:hypothetical protein